MPTPTKVIYASNHTNAELAEFEKIREAELVAREVAMEDELDSRDDRDADHYFYEMEL